MPIRPAAFACLVPALLAGAEPEPDPARADVRVYGLVQVFGQYFFDQYLYDHGSLTGTWSEPRDARATPDRQFSLTARSSRVGVRARVPSDRLGPITGRLELDFTGGKPKAMGKPKVREATLSFRDWEVGYAQSTWIDPDAGPETLDKSGPIGASCQDTGRYTLVRRRIALGPTTRLTLSAEQNTLAFRSWGAADDPNPKVPGDPVVDASGTPVPGQFAGTRQDKTIRPDSRFPSLVAAVARTGARGHASLRLLGQNYGAYRPGSATAPEARPNRWAGAVQLAGHLDLGRDRLAGSVYSGQALGSYGFSPQAARFLDLDQGGRVAFRRSLGWQAGCTHRWNDRLRSNLILAGLRFHHTPDVADTDIRTAENLFVNTILRLAPDLEVGLEYVYEGLRTFGPAGVLQRDGSYGATNHSNKLQAALSFKF